MESILNLKTYVNGVDDTPFPNADNQIVITAFTYDAKRMGSAPTITATVMYETCLDDVWTENVYAEFNGERYYLKQTPSSSYSNEDARYKHELELVSERVIFDNVYFYDVVTADVENDRPVSNSSNVVFFGDIHEFAKRLNYSLQYAKLQSVTAEGDIEGYHVVVDDDENITTEPCLMSFDNQFFSSVLQEIFNTYEVPYYFVGKTIHIGFTDNAITDVFKYGSTESLLSITKENANSRVINRATGIGSQDNLTYYYPNITSRGTLSVLYNGERGLAEITNKNKLDGLALDTEVLRYIVNPSYYMDWAYHTTITYYQIDKLADPLVNSAWDYYTLNVRMEFTPEIVRAVDTVFNIVCHDSNLNSLQAILLASNSEGVQRTIFDMRGAANNQITKTAYLPEGNSTSYILYITATLRYAKGVTPPLEDMAYIDQRILQYKITQSVDEERYWIKQNKDDAITANGEPVENLSDLGIKLSADVTPEYEDTISLYQDNKIITQDNLMPSIYRDTLGAERFYPAINYPWVLGVDDSINTEIGEYTVTDTDGTVYVHNKNYIIPDTDSYYVFENPYEDGKAKEVIVEFEDIKPTIVGMTNAAGNLIGMFSEFAYDKNDNDETEEIDNEQVYKHPYFFGKLRKFDGENGFNLFDHKIESGEMEVSFTSGSCGACKFIISVDEDTQLNPVQVDALGNLIYDENGNVLCGRKHYQTKVDAQDIQQDTRNAEVWVALRKDIDTFGVLMPNAANNYKPKACTKNEDGTYKDDGDTFVLLNIDLPQAYITAAEDWLTEEIIKNMYENNYEKFNFSITFSRIFLAENPSILAQLNENARIKVEYNDQIHVLYVSSYSYAMSADEALPEIKVELSEELTVAKNAIQSAVSNVETSLLNHLNGIDFLASGLKYFIRKDVPDSAAETITFDKGLSLGGEYGLKNGGNATLNTATVNHIITPKISTEDFDASVTGVGAGFYTDENGETIFAADRIIARRNLTVSELIIQEVKSVGGALVISKSNAEIETVTPHTDDTGNIDAYYIKLKNDATFALDDFVRCSRAELDADNKTLRVKSYWVKAYPFETNANYIALMVAHLGDVVPEVGDQLVQMGNATDTTRDGFIIISSEDGVEHISVYDGVNAPTSEALANGLKTRLGNLDNIVWNGKDLNGYGLMANTAYLNGEFSVNIDGTTTDVSEAIKETNTQFEVVDGQINSLITSNYNQARNLLLQTNQGVTGWLYSTNQGAGDIALTPYQSDRGQGVIFEVDRGAATVTPTWEIFMFQLRPEMLTAGTTYTLSADVRMDIGGFKPNLNICLSTSANSLLSAAVVSDTQIVAGEWVTLKWKFTPKTSGAQNGGQMVYIQMPTGYIGKLGYAQFANLKLEVGELATAWSPAPEDTEGAITDMSTQITQTNDQVTLQATQIATLDSKVVENTASIKANATNIGLKVSQTEFDGLKTSLTETGIDIANKQITATADNFTIKNNSGEVTATVDENGQIAGGSLAIKYPTTSDAEISTTQNLATWNEVGKPQGIQRFYYPNGQVQLEIGYDVQTDSVFRFYDENGKLLWYVGGYAGFKSGSTESTWSTITLVPCGTTIPEIPTTTGSLTGTDYWQLTKVVNDTKTSVTVHVSQSETANKINGYFCYPNPPFIMMPTDPNAFGTTYRRTYFKYVDGVVTETNIFQWEVPTTAE